MEKKALQHIVLFIKEIPHSSSCKHIAVTLYGKHREESHTVFCKINSCESIVLAGKVMAVFLFTGQFKISTANLYCEFLTSFSKVFITV